MSAFDMCWPEQRVAVEIQGLTHEGGGRHQRVKGYLAEAEKLEAALQHGWKVYLVPGPWVATADRWIFREEVMDTLRGLLGPADPVLNSELNSATTAGGVRWETVGELVGKMEERRDSGGH